VLRAILILATTALTLAAVIPGSASASASTQPAAGTFTEGPAMNEVARFADGNLILEFTRTVTFTGTYIGMGIADERIVIHKDGSTNVHITIAFTGTACLVPTTLEFLIIGQGQLDENFETGVIAGTYATRGDGFGHGSGKFSGAAGVGGTYEGQAHCA
jgi:hypothetical protein